MQSTIGIGDHIPDFSLKNQDGNWINIQNYIGKAMVIYFYPKDQTIVCTKEACGFRDLRADFNNLDVVIFGISSDSVSSHKIFHRLHSLNFDLLSDSDSSLQKLFGATKFFGLLPSRKSFVVDKNGIIVGIVEDIFNAEKHIQFVQEKLKGVKDQK